MPLSAHVVDATTFLSFTFDGAAAAGETDAGASGRNASFVALTPGSTLPSVAGYIGNARQFSRSVDAYLKASIAPADMSVFDGEFTVEWRMKLRSLNPLDDSPELFFIGGATTAPETIYSVRAYVNPADASLILNVADGRATYDVTINTGYAVPIGEWHHYAVVSYFDGSIYQFKCYVDGVEVYDTLGLPLGLGGGYPVAGATWDTGWPAVQIGSDTGEQFFPNADYDDFCIRSDARTAAQILADATGTVSVTAPVASVELVQGETATVAWTSRGFPNAKVEYSADNGATWTTATASTDASAGTYSWTVPAVSTTRGRVRVSEATDGSPAASSATFTIVPALPTAYQHQLRQLLPRGVLWTGALKSMLNRTLASLGDELARVVARGVVLVEESDPSTATETLPEWESAWGLPDATVTEIPATSALRRLAITQKVIKTGGQNAAYYIQIAAACGYTVTVTDGFSSTVFRTGVGRTGSRLYGVEWAHYWVMTITATDPVALSHAELERIITEISPAHTVVAFVYV